MTTIKTLWWLSLSIGMAPLLIFLLESKDTAEMGLTIASTCGLAQAVLIRIIPSFKIKFETLKRELLSIATIYVLELLLIIIAFCSGRLSGLEFLIGSFLLLGMTPVPFAILWLKLDPDPYY